MNHDGSFDVLDMHIHGHKGDEEDGGGGQVDGDDVVSDLPFQSHHEDGRFVNIFGGHLCH